MVEPLFPWPRSQEEDAEWDRLHMGCTSRSLQKKKRPLENWWGNGSKPNVLWTDEDWLAWAKRVEDEDKLYYDRPPRPKPKPRPRYTDTIRPCPICMGIINMNTTAMCPECGHSSKSKHVVGEKVEVALPRSLSAPEVRTVKE
jgi:hypothetical protein